MPLFYLPSISSLQYFFSNRNSQNGLLIYLMHIMCFELCFIKMLPPHPNRYSLTTHIYKLRVPLCKIGLGQAFQNGMEHLHNSLTNPPQNPHTPIYLMHYYFTVYGHSLRTIHTPHTPNAMNCDAEYIRIQNVFMLKFNALSHYGTPIGYKGCI